MHTWLKRNQCRIFFAPDAFCVKISFLEGTFFFCRHPFSVPDMPIEILAFLTKQAIVVSIAVVKMSIEISVCSDKVESSYTRNENVLKKLVVCSLVLRIWLFLIMTSGFFFQRHSTIGGCIDKKSIKPRDSRPTII